MWGKAAILVALVTGSSVAAGWAAAAAGPGSGSAGGISPSAPCGANATSPVAITKLLVVVMENTDYGAVMGSPQAPTINNLAAACGLATEYHGIQFPSLPNYLAMTSGDIPASIAGDGVRGHDCLPVSPCVSSDQSIFGQIDEQSIAHPAAPLSWTVYAEAMPQPCFLQNQDTYAARHNPAVYYTQIRSTSCPTQDVPLGTLSSGALATDLAGGSLPNYSMLIPNLCNDGHDACNGQPRVSEEDHTVATWLPAIIASPDYQSGRLLIVITADTSSSPANDNRLATILVNPNIPPATQSDARYDHYTLLRLSEQLLGLTPLANAAHSPDMAQAFNLPLPTTHPTP
jgi:hypothetical protein